MLATYLRRTCNLAGCNLHGAVGAAMLSALDVHIAEAEKPERNAAVEAAGRNGVVSPLGGHKEGEEGR